MTATPNRPPALATLLLTRSVGHNDPLVGDLAEEYQRRQSRWWFWRQVLAAVALHFVAEVRGHWIIAVRGILMGMVLLKVSNWVLSPVTDEANRWLRDHVPGHISMQRVSIS